MIRTRPRGFINDWQPKSQTVELIATVDGILEDNSDLLPLTLRQIFYVLVSNHRFDKTEQAYQRLCEVMNRARRAQHIDMDAIRDDGFTELEGPGWESEQSFIGSVKHWASEFTLDRQADQPVKIFLWCEAAGMAPQLRKAAAEYHVPVFSSGGFDSLTSKHDMAARLAEVGQAVILHLGDHDPSGVHMFSSLDEDLQAFLDHYGGDVTMTRLAVTPRQVADMDLPTAPPKRTDNRRFAGNETTQCEAIPPRELARIVLGVIEARIDFDVYADTLKREAEDRASAMRRTRDI